MKRERMKKALVPVGIMLLAVAVFVMIVLDLTKEQLSRLKQGTDKALQKGIQESLVLVDNLAFIVNIKNRTVVTAMDQMESKENIFTNIDGAVIS